MCRSDILVGVNMHIPGISISAQHICRREIREVRVDRKSLGLIAYDDFLLLAAPSLKKQSAEVSAFETPQE